MRNHIKKIPILFVLGLLVIGFLLSVEYGPYTAFYQNNEEMFTRKFSKKEDIPSEILKEKKVYFLSHIKYNSLVGTVVERNRDLDGDRKLK